MTTATTVTIPPPLTIRANNWFHDGWLHAVLGLGKRIWDNVDDPVRDEDIDAWVDGYDMAVETDFDIRPVFAMLVAHGQLVVKDVLK